MILTDCVYFIKQVDYGYYVNIILQFSSLLNKSKIRFFAWEGGVDVYVRYSVYAIMWHAGTCFFF